MRYSIQQLPNGFIRVFDRCSGMSGLYNRDGSFHSGSCRNRGYLVIRFLKDKKQ